MAMLTGAALLVIRVSYFTLWGPDADPYGAYKHFAIDFAGMGAHVLGAWVVARVVRGASA